jgi:hypothetical protein
MSAQSGHPAAVRNTPRSIGDPQYLPQPSSPQAPELHLSAKMESQPGCRCRFGAAQVGASVPIAVALDPLPRAGRRRHHQRHRPRARASGVRTWLNLGHNDRPSSTFTEKGIDAATLVRRGARTTERTRDNDSLA